jgi:hypothetical protein
MNDTNPKIVNVRKAFDALPQKGRLIECDGKVASNFDFNTHIQGLAAYRTLHFLTYSEFNQSAGRLLSVDRTPGHEKLVGELRLPVLSSSRPFYFHPGGCQVIGDCLVLPAETGEGQSFVLFMDVSDPDNIHEVNPAVRLARPFNDTGAVGITNVTAGGKDFWVLAAYDNGATDVYISEDAFPGAFKHAFPVDLEENGLQSLQLVTDVDDTVFAIGLHRAFPKDMAILYEVDLVKKTFRVVKERHFKTTGPDDLFGTGCHFRWGGGIEILSATELALYCTEFRYDDGCNLNEFRAAPPKPKVARRRAAATPKTRRKAKTRALRASKRRRPAKK